MSNQVSCTLCGNKYEKTEDGVEAACPLCGGSGNQRLGKWDGSGIGDGSKRLRDESTDALEDQLKTLSARIASDPLRFDEIRAELAFRRRTKDEQPTPTLRQAGDAERERKEDAAKLNTALTLKITAMEAEQAKLVLEVEAAKAAQREAEDRLAIIARATRSTLTQAPSGATRYLDVVLDGPPGPEGGRFVELEDERGMGTSAGSSWIAPARESKSAMWRLRIPMPEAAMRVVKDRAFSERMASLITELRSVATEAVVVGAAAADPESAFALRLLRDHGLES